MNTHRRLLGMTLKSKALLPLVVLSGFLASGLIIFQSWQLSKVIDALFLKHAGAVEVLPALRTILIIVLLRVVFTFTNDLLASNLAEKIKTELRKALLNKIDRLGPVWLRRQKTGEVSTTILQGVDALDAYFSQFLPQVVLAALLPLTILLFVLPLDLLTGVVFLITAPLIPLFMVLIGRMAESVTRRQWTRLRQMGDFLLDSLRGLKTLLILGRSKQRLEELRGVSEKYRVSTLNVLKITFLSAFTLEMIATIATAVVAVEIGLRLMNEQLDFQSAFFILLVAPEFYLPMRNLSMRYHAGMSGVTAAASIFKILDTREENLSRPLNQSSEPLIFAEDYRVLFKDVSYKYEASNRDAVEHFTFTFERGRNYALVGENGAGKSTLTHLLMQFLQPTSGLIEVDGKDIRSWSPEIWRKSISWVGQKPMIFNANLRENIRLFDSSYKDDQVEEAIENAMLGRLFHDLPQGLDTPLLESGIRFSSGERQRIAIARAFLKNGSLVLMDEPTSHLDTFLDEEFLNLLAKLLQDRISLVIAHHVPLMRISDEILVMQQGRLVENGTFETLQSKRETFSNLIRAGEV